MWSTYDRDHSGVLEKDIKWRTTHRQKSRILEGSSPIKYGCVGATNIHWESHSAQQQPNFTFWYYFWGNKWVLETQDEYYLWNNIFPHSLVDWSEYFAIDEKCWINRCSYLFILVSLPNIWDWLWSARCFLNLEIVLAKTILEISAAALWESSIQFYFGNCFEGRQFWKSALRHFEKPEYNSSLEIVLRKTILEMLVSFESNIHDISFLKDVEMSNIIILHRSTSCDKTMYFSFKFIFARATIAFVWTLSWWESSTSLLFWIIEKAAQLLFF